MIDDSVCFVQRERVDFLSSSLRKIDHLGRVLLDQLFSYGRFQNRRELDQRVAADTRRRPLRGRNDASQECGGDQVDTYQGKRWNPVEIQRALVVVASTFSDDPAIKP
ncbi:hypothetical protein D3C84_1088230 [compost metagenome]